jgi:ribosomal protein L11 methyltransferase
MPATFVEVRIRVEIDSGELIALLQDNGIIGGWEKEDFVYLYWPEDKWEVKKLEKLKRTLEKLGVQDTEDRVEAEPVPEKDWNAAWTASLHPIYVGRKLRIRQSWHAPDTGFEGIELVMDPKRAFGTGHHATTQMIVEWMEANIRGGERVLDIGTGTGILAMAAIRLGAYSALAVDNDPVAVECAQEYAKANGFGNELGLRECSWEELGEEKFNVILANLDSRTMPQLCANMARLMKTGGIACLSGLMEHDYETIAGALAGAGLRITARIQREEWLAIEVRG